MGFGTLGHLQAKVSNRFFHQDYPLRQPGFHAEEKARLQPDPQVFRMKKRHVLPSNKKQCIQMPERYRYIVKVNFLGQSNDPASKSLCDIAFEGQPTSYYRTDERKHIINREMVCFGGI